MEKKRENKEKTKWFAVLFLAILSFILAFLTQQILFNLIAIGLAIIVYKYGNPVLFKEYDERRRKNTRTRCGFDRPHKQLLPVRNYSKNRKKVVSTMSDGRMIFEREREDLARIVKLIFARKNTNVAGGNFSFKTTDQHGKEYIIMTPTMMSEAYLGEVSSAQILVVEPHTRKVIDGVGKLTREINLHEAVYDTNPEIKAVLHAHAPNAMFWATAGLDMPNLTEATQKVGYVPVLDFEPNCSPELAELVSNYMKKRV